MSNNSTSHANEKPRHIRNLLKNPPKILNGFHHEDLLEFLGIGIKEQYANDDIVVDKSDYVNSAYLICEGEVGVWEDNIELTTLGTNDFLGETFLFSDSNRMSKIVAKQDTIVLRFQRHDMLIFFKKKPGKLFNIFIRNIIDIQRQKLASMNELLLGAKKKLLMNEIKH